MTDLLHADMLAAAKSAIRENLRHTDESLRELMWRWFPEADDADIDSVIKEAL